jgi:hypothetical protein
MLFDELSEKRIELFYAVSMHFSDGLRVTEVLIAFAAVLTAAVMTATIMVLTTVMTASSVSSQWG